MSDHYVIGKAKETEPTIEQPDGAGIIPSLHFRWLLSGPSKSGKSNLARWCLDKYYMRSKGKSWFDKIYLLSPTAYLDHLWSDLPGLKDDNRIPAPTADDLQMILDMQTKVINGGSLRAPKMTKSYARKLHKRKEKADNILLIFDDAIAESSLINSSVFLKIFIQGRHYGISSMVMSQSYMKVPRSVRLQATHVSMFPSKKTEIDRLYTEHGPRQLSKNQFTEMVQHATAPSDDDQFPFLHVSCFDPVDVRFRRNLNQTIRLKKEDVESSGNEESEEKTAEAREPVSDFTASKNTRKRKRHISKFSSGSLRQP